MSDHHLDLLCTCTYCTKLLLPRRLTWQQSPPPNSTTLPALVPVGLGGYTWAFVGGAAGREQASHLAGALQALNPGLKVKLIYNTGTKVVTHL